MTKWAIVVLTVERAIVDFSLKNSAWTNFSPPSAQIYLAEPSHHILTYHSHTFFSCASVHFVDHGCIHCHSCIYLCNIIHCVKPVGKHSTEWRHNNQQVQYNTTQ